MLDIELLHLLNDDYRRYISIRDKQRFLSWMFLCTYLLICFGGIDKVAFWGMDISGKVLLQFIPMLFTYQFYRSMLIRNAICRYEDNIKEIFKEQEEKLPLGPLFSNGSFGEWIKEILFANQLLQLKQISKLKGDKSKIDEYVKEKFGSGKKLLERTSIFSLVVGFGHMFLVNTFEKDKFIVAFHYFQLFC